MKPLVCVRHQQTAPLGVIEDVLDSHDVNWTYLDAWRRGTFPHPSEMSGLIVLGGEMNVDELDRYPFLQAARDLMMQAVHSQLPVLGVCLGAQILTRALGAEVTPAPARELGFVPVKATAAGMNDPLLEPFAPEACVFQFHEDECELPEGAELLLEGSDVEVQAFRAGERAYAVQFHFEVTREEIEAWWDETADLEESCGAGKQEVMQQATSHLEGQQRAGRETARRFISLLR
jgi:GMP synthase (glutamine-hydrolysing)